MAYESPFICFGKSIHLILIPFRGKKINSHECTVLLSYKY